jgi:MFS family permease
MYQFSPNPVAVRPERRLRTSRQAESRVPRVVILIGLTSMFTDISSEMVVAVLPLYLVSVGGFSPLAFGLIDGLYTGGAALIGLAGGYGGDRWRRHKEMAATGYGLSAFSRLALVTGGTAVSSIGAIVLIDRIGKGIRTAPRDAMISLATPRRHLGAAFGVHRALDTTGAMLGPLVAFGILALAPLAFTSIFLVSFCLALVGLAILVLFVERPRSAPDAIAPPPPATLRRAFGLVRIPRYRALLIAGGALSVATVSDAFIFLALQREMDLGNSLFPLLFVGTAAAYMLLAVPMGRLADRVGRGRVFLGGYGLLAIVYAALLLPIGGPVLAITTLGLLGAYYAATDGVLMALASAVVPDELRGSGLALVRTVTSVSRLLASVAFGALWFVWTIDLAIATFGGALLAATAAAALVLARNREPAGV